MPESSKPPSGKRMKARAPPPPSPAPLPAPRHIFRNAVPDGGGASGMDAKENMLRPTVDLQVTLPQGSQTSVTEDGSKALMDLLVELCSRHHLNPALHTLELLSPDGRSLGFKPNAPLGSLDVDRVLIKEKVWEERVVRRPAPKVPEKTVRLMVNYHGSQKAVVRVNPFVPLQALVPVVCDKCDFEAAHVLLLRDAVGRRELPLDKSLTELGIKELYVHNRSLVLQPQRASAPALNYSDSIRSSTTSLDRAEKKGLLGIFQFSRRKTKTDTTSVDMDDCDEDKVTQITDTRSNGVSTASGVSGVEDRPGTLGQSQSVMNISRMSPRAETKKRRAPALPGAPTPTMGHASFEGYEMGLGSESQQRKRKAPAPPPTPASISPGPGDSSSSSAPTPDDPATEAPTPGFFFRYKAVQSNAVSAAAVVTKAATPVKPENPSPVRAASPTPSSPTPSSPTPSSSTTESLAVQDSSSDLGHGLDDSDADLDQAASYCSTLSSSSAASGSAASARVQSRVQSGVQPATESSSRRRAEESGKAGGTGTAARLNQEATSAGSSRSETELALNLKLDDVENNRHSAMGAADQPAPPKPRRCAAQEPAQLVPPTAALSSLPIEPTGSSVEAEEAAPQSWLHSMQSSTAGCRRKPEAETPEEETASLGSSSSGSSLPDQGYAASEGTAEGEGEDSGTVGSPSDTQPTSPDGNLSPDDGGRGGGGERLLGPERDDSSDSDEGCATWGSRHRHNDITPQAKSGRLKDGFEDDPELTARLHRTLAEFEADLADHVGIVSSKDTRYTTSTDSNEVPVSVVDMDVPVTAIDEVLEDYERHAVENETTSLTRVEPAGRKGFCHQSSVEPQNQNNNACTAADGNRRSSSANTKQPSQPDQHRKSLENKSTAEKKERKMLGTKFKETSAAETDGVKEHGATPAAKPNVDLRKHGKVAETKPDARERKPALPPSGEEDLRRSVSAERGGDEHGVHQNNSGPNAAHGKITRNVTSRFGMKTFTVVPPKPAAAHAAAGEPPAVKLTVGAIKIDDQGNMVKGGGVSRSKAGAVAGDGSSEAGINAGEGSPLLGKAKAFWSSNERQESAAAPRGKGLADEAKESPGADAPAPAAAISVATSKSRNAAEELKTTTTTHDSFRERAERARPREAVGEGAAEMEGKMSASKNVRQPSHTPALPRPLLPDLQRDLSFLKPSRRTSSQYVASAITKYAPRHQAHPSAKPGSAPNAHDSSSSSSAPLTSQTVGFQRSGRSAKVNPPHQSSQSSSQSDDKENDSASKSNPPDDPKRSAQASYPERVGGARPDWGGFGSRVGSARGSSNALETETAATNNNNKHIQSGGGPAQKNTIASNDTNGVKQVRLRSPSPAHSSAKPPTVHEAASQSLTSNTSDVTKAAARLTPDAKPQPSVTVSANKGAPPAGPPPPPVTLFGPVQKFRPVISRSVEKNTSLHSSLMDAIQTGGARDRLKKITASGLGSVKKASDAEEENERSALLAAIRAQSSGGRLRKTKSEAAGELVKIRKATSETEVGAGQSPPSFTGTPPPVFTPPPAPPPPPPPPPIIAPALPQGKPSTSANTSTNPALARDAMLEAIRSGSAAERLKKVAAPTKTVQVNGRLGTIQATSSTLPRQ